MAITDINNLIEDHGSEAMFIHSIMSDDTIKSDWHRVDIETLRDEKLYKEYLWAKKMRLVMVADAVAEKKAAMRYGRCYSEKSDGQHCECWWDCMGPCHWCGIGQDLKPGECDCDFHTAQDIKRGFQQWLDNMDEQADIVVAGIQELRHSIIKFGKTLEQYLKSKRENK